MKRTYNIKSLNLELSFEQVIGFAIGWKRQNKGVSVVFIIPFVIIQYN